MLGCQTLKLVSNFADLHVAQKIKLLTKKLQKSFQTISIRHRNQSRATQFNKKGKKITACAKPTTIEICVQILCTINELRTRKKQSTNYHVATKPEQQSRGASGCARAFMKIVMMNNVII